MNEKKKVSVFLTDRFETVEALAVVDVLRRAGIETDIISITGKIEVASAQKITVQAEYLFEDYSFDGVDMLFLPGGPGHRSYEQHEGLKNIVNQYNKENKMIAAICAAPSFLGNLGVLDNKRATCFPGCESALANAEYVHEKVVSDGNIITGIGMGASIEMGLEMVKVLLDKETADELAKTTQFILS